MKKNTFNIVTKIPIIGNIIEFIIIDPTINSSVFINSDNYNKIRDYSIKHPDVVISRKIMKEIISK